MKKFQFYYFIAFICLSIFYSCEDKYFDAIEPDLSGNTNNPAVGDFAISDIQISDNSIYFTWNRPVNAIKYDVIINDTISKREIFDSEFGNDAYFFADALKPDTEYKITVRAYTSANEIKNISFTSKTKKYLIDNVKRIIFKNYNYNNNLYFSNYYITASNDFILTIVLHTQQVILKINKSYEFEWMKSFGDGFITDITEFSDGALFITTSNSVTKMSSTGEILWKKNISIPDVEINAGFAMEDNSCLLAGSIFSYGPTRQSYIAKLNSTGEIIWEDFGDKKVYDDMYLISKILVNAQNNIVIAGGTWNDGSAYQGKENFFFWEYNQDGMQIANSTFNISQIPYYSGLGVQYLEQLQDKSYLIFTSIPDWSSGRYNTAILTMKIDEDFHLLEYEKKYFTAGGYFPSIKSVYKRNDSNYSWLLGDDRGIILVDVDKNGNEKYSKGFYDFPNGFFSFSNDNNQTIYFSKNGLIITINNDGNYDGYPRFTPDELIICN